VKDLGRGNGSPKADKPSSLGAAKNALESVEPSSPKNTKDLPAGAEPLSPKATEETPKVKKPPSPTATEETPGTNREKTSKESLPSPSPQMQGLGAAADSPAEDGLAVLRVKKVPQSSARVADSLAKDPDFIKVRSHIGKFITAAVNT
jgi:hypothetical protein